MAMIEVRNLTKKYDFGRVRGVENMSFSVEEGELFGFIGKNGAGKSTTIRILMNMIHADSGAAKIDGLNCRTRSRAIKKFTGYMPSEVHCYATATAGELLNYACWLRGEKKNTWRELADYFALDTTKRFRELSIGNRRKLSIIQAMMFRPRLLILDEPTAGLDPLMQEKFFSALVEAQKNGVTVFFSSHNLSEVQKYCSRVALVKDGRIEMMPDMNELSMHEVEIATDADCGMLLGHINALDVKRSPGKISFMMPGDELPALISALGGLEITDITITKPSLERAFHKTYYGEDTAE